MFITHNLSVVKHISHEIMVMYLGCQVEKCASKELFQNPLHPYTKGLLSAIPIPSIHVNRQRIVMSGEVTSPLNPKPGAALPPGAPMPLSSAPRSFRRWKRFCRTISVPAIGFGRSTSFNILGRSSFFCDTTAADILMDMNVPPLVSLYTQAPDMAIPLHSTISA